MSITETCLKVDNMGWRYTLYTLGSIVVVLALIRLLVFKIPESPYFLLSRGRDAEAIEVVSYLAKQSKRPVALTLDQFRSINERHGRVTNDSTTKPDLKNVVRGHL